MAFTGQGGAGQTVTQTAGTTDANPSGITALSGVTTRTQGLLTIIDLNGANLVIVGTLTIDPRTHRITGAAAVTINNGGTLNAGVQFASSFGGGTLYSSGDAITFAGRFINYGTFNQRGAGMNATATAANNLHIFNGTVFMREAKWSTGVNNNHRLRMTTSNCDIDGLDTYGVQFDALMTPTASTILKNIRPANVGVGIENALNNGAGTTQVQTYDGVPETAGKVSAFTSNWQGLNDIRLIACEAGSAEIVMPDFTGNAGTSGHGGRIYQQYQIGATRTAGSAIQGAISYLKDTNNGLRKVKAIVGGALIDNTADQVHILTTDASGLTPVTTLLTSHIYRNNTVGDLSAPDGNEIRDLRGKVNTPGSDLFDVYLLAYGYQITPILDIPMKGLSLTAESAKMLADSNVTLTQAQAAALTQIDNLDQLYDAGKDWKCQAQQARLEYPSISTQPITASGTVLNLDNRNLVVDGAAADDFAINTATNTITIKSLALAAGAKFKSLTTTGTVTFVNGATSSGIAIEDANGVRVTIRKSGGGNFNIAARYGSGSTYTDLGYQADVSTITYTVPKGQPVEVVMWALGYVTYSRLISTVNGGVVFDAEMTLNESINTSLDVSPYLPNIALSLDTSGASPVFVITFNAAMTISGIELGKAVIHRLVGQEIALKAGFPPGSTATIVINSDEITNQLPDARLALGAGLSVTDRVYLDFFINTAPALAINPAYVINPPRADGNQVVILRAKPALDASVMALVVRQEIERTGGMLDGKASQASVTALAAANQTEHDATQAAIAALPAPLTATQTRTQVDAALTAYDAVVPADLAILATAAQVTALGAPLQAGDYTAPATAQEIAAQVELAIIDEDDGRQVIEAIANKIKAEEVTAGVIAAMVRAEIKPDLQVINTGVKSASLAVPHGLNLPS